jgi:hypothetical protein
MEPPGFPQPLDVTESDRHLLRRFGNRLKDQAAWTGGIVAEYVPQHGLESFRDFSSRTHVWPRDVTWGALGYMHASILLQDQHGRSPQSSQCLFFIQMKSES